MRPATASPVRLSLALALALAFTFALTLALALAAPSPPTSAHPHPHEHEYDAPPTRAEVRTYGLRPFPGVAHDVELDGGGDGGRGGDGDGEHRGAGRDARGWADPNLGGGSMLDVVTNGLREPINAILSSHSDPYILSDAGLRDYVRSIGFSFECLDLHIGDLQRANLGDGAGWREEMFEYRSTRGFGAPGRWVGACWESWEGGNHFRAWKQNGSEANTGAWFLAVSTEKNLRHNHMITPNGYNLGRDLLVEAAVRGGHFGNRLWKAQVEWVQGLLPAGSDGINHGIEIDGLVAVLTVQRYWSVSHGHEEEPAEEHTSSSSEAQSHTASTSASTSAGTGTPPPPGRPPTTTTEMAARLWQWARPAWTALAAWAGAGAGAGARA